MNMDREIQASQIEWESLITHLSQGQDLSADQMQMIVRDMMQGVMDESLASRLLTALHRKGEVTEELVGAAKALREFMTPIRSSRVNVIDTCGTGGGSANTFNISTAVAIVCAAAGASVAKHGNKRSTSKSGSSDALEALGVNVAAPVATVERCLDELGICFCFAPLFHPSVKNVMAIRRQLPHPTIFNLLGPLCNPASAPFQLLGVGRGGTRALVAEALSQLGTIRSLVVHGAGGLGEVSLSGPTAISWVEGQTIREVELQPRDFGVSEQPIHLLRVDSPQESAQVIQQVLVNQSGPARDIVLMNAAVALVTAEVAADWQQGTEMADRALSSGAAATLLKNLIDLSHAL